MFEALFDWMDPVSNRPPVRVESSAPFTPYFVIEGNIPEHNITITVSAFTESFLRKRLPVKVAWYKSFREKEYKISNHEHPFYHCCPADVDLTLRAEITCLERGFEGKASIFVGPIKMSPNVNCELQSSIFLQDHVQNVLLLQVNDEKVKINNKTRLSVQKGFFQLNFDPCMAKHPQLSRITDWMGFKCAIGEKPNPQEEELTISFDNVDPKNLYITRRVPGSLQPEEANQMAQSWQDHSLPKSTVYKVQFFSRYDRDMFYIIFRLYRMLKVSAIEMCIGSFEQLVGCQWLFLHWRVWEESGVYQDDPFDTDEVNSDNLLQYDLVREKFRSLIRLNRQLLSERTEKMDLLDVMQTDLELAKASLAQLIEDAKGAQKRGRRLGRLEISRYEDKSKSILAETSVIIDERKIKTKSGKRNLEDQKVEELIECQAELQNLKEANQGIKKSLESLKKPSSKPTANQNQFKDATGGNEFISFQNNEMNLFQRNPETLIFHQPAQAVSASPAKHGKLYKLLKAWNRRLSYDLSSQKEATNELRESWRRFCAAIDSGVFQNSLSEQGYLAFVTSLLQRAYLAREQAQNEISTLNALAARRQALTEAVLLSELDATRSPNQQSSNPSPTHQEAVLVLFPTTTPTPTTTAAAPQPAEDDDPDDLLLTLQQQLAAETQRTHALQAEAVLLVTRSRVLQASLHKTTRDVDGLRLLTDGREEELARQLEEVRQELSLLQQLATG